MKMAELTEEELKRAQMMIDEGYFISPIVSVIIDGRIGQARDRIYREVTDMVNNGRKAR